MLFYQTLLSSCQTRHTRVFAIELASAPITLSCMKILNLLASDRVHFSDSTYLEYECDDSGAYSLLEEKNCSITVIAKIKIQIKYRNISDFTAHIDRIIKGTSRITSLENNMNRYPQAERAPEANIVILSAFPLVRHNGPFYKDYCASDLNLMAERKEIEEELRNHSVHGKIAFKTATLDNLKEAIKSPASVIQISCHGSHRADSFILSFENSQKLGLCDDLTVNQLRLIIQEASPSLKVVFLSACFSETISCEFLDAGVPCVVSVNSKCQIYNPAAVRFSKVFHTQLLSNMTIESAFSLARDSVKSFSDERIKGIRCRHRHEIHCVFGKNKGRYLAELPQCSCGDELRSQFHHIECQWVVRFIEIYDKKRQFTEAEREQERVLACCCSPELPHDPYNQFVIHYRNESVLGESILSEKIPVTDEPFEIINAPKSPICPYELGKAPIKRNEEMFSLLLFTKRNRLISIVGPPNSGKTVLVRSAAQYAYERNSFSSGVIYLSFAINHPREFKRLLIKYLSLPRMSYNEILQHLHDQYYLIIVDLQPSLEEPNLDDEKELRDLLVRLKENTAYCIVWIVSESWVDVNVFQKLNLYDTKPLVEFIRKYLEQSLAGANPCMILQSAARKIVESSGRIIEKADREVNRLKRGASVDMPILAPQNSVPGEPSLSIQLRNFYFTDEVTVDFLAVLALFPHGITTNCLDLLFLYSGKKYCYKHCIDILREKKTSASKHSGWFVSNEENDYFLLTEDATKVVFNEKKYMNMNSLFVLEFLSCLARELLEKLVVSAPYSHCDAMKSLCNFNPLFPCGIWDHCNSPLKSSISKFLAPFSQNQLKSLFSFMKRNFLYYIEPRNLRAVFKAQISSVKQFVFDLGESLVSMNLLFNQREYAFEVIRSVMKSLNSYSDNDLIQLTRGQSAPVGAIEARCELKYKLKLTELAAKFEWKEEWKRIEFELQELKDHFRVSNEQCYGECLMLEAHVWMETQDLTNVKSARILEVLGKAMSEFKEAENELSKARLQVVQADYYVKVKKKVTEKFLLELKQYQRVINSHSLTGLELRLLSILGDLYYIQENFTQAEAEWSTGFYLALNIKDRKSEKEFGDKLK